MTTRTYTVVSNKFLYAKITAICEIRGKFWSILENSEKPGGNFEGLLKYFSKILEKFLCNLSEFIRYWTKFEKNVEKTYALWNFLGYIPKYFGKNKNVLNIFIKILNNCGNILHKIEERLKIFQKTFIGIQINQREIHKRNFRKWL